MDGEDDTSRVIPGESKGSQASIVEPSDPVSGWTHKGITRLDTLAKLNANPHWVNDELYRLMYSEDLFIIAYERIKSSPGNMTPGNDGETLDGFSLSLIRGIIARLRSNSFDFRRARRVYIPKADGKRRPLGIAPPTDKVVQEVIRMILEAVYDSPYGATFSDHSHGFRPRRGTHTALKDIRSKWSGVTWLVEGDIKGCFDNIDHARLMQALRKRIRDERFLGLIWKALRCGYMEFHLPVDSFIGTPQGSIVSPLLANIFLHQLDEFVEREFIAAYQGGHKRQATPEYRKVCYRLQKARLALKASSDPAEQERYKGEIRTLKNVQLSTKAYSDDPTFIRIKYLRYADDWLVGINGPKELAETIKERSAVFLESIGLTLSLEKTHIRHAKTEEANFLGTRISIGSTSPSSKRVEHGGKTDLVGTRRVTGWFPRMFAPIDEIVRRLHDQGMCDGEGWPTRKSAWLHLDDVDIIQMYSSTLRGYLNYFSFVDNYVKLGRIQYILLFSLVKTLANKHRLSVPETFRKYGKPPRVTVEPEGRKATNITFHMERDWRRRPSRFHTATHGGPEEIVSLRYSRLNKSKLGRHCIICGTTEDIQMHHLRHIRKMGAAVKGFAKLMAGINRKQVPLCHEHHVAVHAGKYDGVSLSSLFDAELAKA